METVPRPEVAAHLAVFGAAPDDVEKKQREIREQIARDERARAAADAERRARRPRRAPPKRTGGSWNASGPRCGTRASA